MKDLTKYNYDDLVEKATTLLKDKEGWGDGYQSSIGQTLIQLLADTTDNLHYLLERRTIEGFMHHARLYSSVLSRASELGYRPHRASGHGGVVRLTVLGSSGLPTPPTFEMFIPRYTVLNQDDRIFYTDKSVTISNTQSSVEIPVKEGSYTEEVFAVTELNEMNELFIRDWKKIDNNSFNVRVGSDEWLDVRLAPDVNKRALTFLTETDQMFDIKYTTEGMFIVFGDGWFGAKPDDQITVSYMSVEDEEPIFRLGNTFTSADGGFRDVQDPTIIYDVEVENITVLTGGRPPETIESIKLNATAYHQTNGRAVTNTDYAFWSKYANIGNIVDVSAYGEQEINTYVYNSNNVYITYATPDYSKLALVDRIALRDYLSVLKTTQAHLVIQPAEVFHLIARTSVRKYANVPTSETHTYDMIRKFIFEYFKVKSDSIGGFFHNSDVINDFYGIKYTDKGVTKPLVDFVKWDMCIGAEYNFPSAVRGAKVGISAKGFVKTSVGDDWVIIINGVVCKITKIANEQPVDFLLRMRDTIRELTDIEVELALEGGAIDENGNMLEIIIDPKVGYHLLIGRDSSNRNINEVISPVDIGSFIAKPTLYSDGFTIHHYYYNPKAGARPTIPLRDATRVQYTTPSDTVVEVWVKDSYDTASVYKKIETLAPSTAFERTFNDPQLLQFRQLSDSIEDAIVEIEYYDWEGARIGLNLRHVNKQSKFNVEVLTGDYKEYAYVDYQVMATRPPEIINSNRPLIMPNTVVIYDKDGVEVAKDDGFGKFIDNDGKIDYKNGIVTPPSDTYISENYMISYKQDEYNNIYLGSGDILKTPDIPDNIDDDTILSHIKIV